MTKWSVNHRSILAMLCVVLSAVGIVSFFMMEQQENPTIVSPAATVTCIYPGASPESVEKEIIEPLEDELGGIAEIKTQESYALDSVGIIKITLKDLSDQEIAEVWNDVKDKVDIVKQELPENADEPVVDTDLASAYGFIVGLSSEEYNGETIHRAAEELKKELLTDEDVKMVDIEGVVDQQIEINLDMLKMQQYGIAPNTVGTLIGARNVNIPGGTLKLDGTKVPVEISGEYGSIDELSHTIVSVAESGTPIYLSDLATIQKTDATEDSLVRINGVPGVLVGVQYADGIKVPDAEKRLLKIMERYRAQQLYADMNMDLIYDQAIYINDSVTLFTSNLLAAIVLMLVVVLLCMGPRSSFIVSLPIPLVIFVVFIYMFLTEVPLHQVSIASLILCLSLLVANGIVSNDNINVYLENGADSYTACTKGVKEVAIPILTSTLTTVASFLPLAMMQGSAGKFVKSLPILVTVALAASFVASLTVIPALSFALLQKQEKKREAKKAGVQRKKPWFSLKSIQKPEGNQSMGIERTEIERASENGPMSRFFHWEKKHGGKSKFSALGTEAVEGYEVLLRKSLKIPRTVIGIALAAFIATLLILFTMKVLLFPPITRDQYVLNVVGPDGATVEHTAALAEQVAEVLDEQPSIDQYSYTVGKGYMKYYVTFFPNDQSSNKAQFLIDGTRAEAVAVEKAVQEQVPGAQTVIKYLEINLPSQWPVQVRFSGEDTETLRILGEQAAQRIRSVEGVHSLEDNYGNSTYKLQVEVKEEMASLVGLTNYEIASTVRMAVNGVEISKMRQAGVDGVDLPIVAKISDEDQSTRDVLDTIFLTSSVTGANVPLGQVAEIKTEMSPGKILRRNGERTLTLGVNVETDYNINDVSRSVEEALEDFALPDGYTMEYGGENESREETFSSMKLPGVLAVVLIYLTLAFQFGDLKQPFIILGTIPLSFMGVFWGLKLMNYPVGFMALIGAFSLMGVVVNNGIVLLDYIRIQLPNFENPVEAIVYACKTRMRPIMIGMITTVISLLPLMISGGDLWAPLATAIVFGMLVSSVLTMLVIPSAFLILFRKGDRTKKAEAHQAS